MSAHLGTSLPQPVPCIGANIAIFILVLIVLQARAASSRLRRASPRMHYNPVCSCALFEGLRTMTRPHHGPHHALVQTSPFLCLCSCCCRRVQHPVVNGVHHLASTIIWYVVALCLNVCSPCHVSSTPCAMHWSKHRHFYVCAHAVAGACSIQWTTACIALHPL